MTLDVALFPCLSDNYGFLLHDPESGATAAIDTPDAKEIAKQCETRGWKLTEIWNTHWHPDHAGGNVALKRRYGCTVKGPQQEAIPAQDKTLSGGDQFDFGGHSVEVIHTPGQRRCFTAPMNIRCLMQNSRCLLMVITQICWQRLKSLRPNAQQESRRFQPASV